MPKSRQRWVTSASTSTKEPASSSNSTRSRAVSLPAACCRAMRSGPPPSAAAASRLSSSCLRSVSFMRRGSYPSPNRCPWRQMSRPSRLLRETETRWLGPVQQSPAMPWSELDTAAFARTLAQIAEQPDDLVDAYFEWREEVELPPEDEAPGLRVWREEGFAVRLMRGQRTWMASRDGIAERPFAEALRQVARALPPVGYPEPRVRAAPIPAGAAGASGASEPGGGAGISGLAPRRRDFPPAVARAVRAHHVGIPVRLTVRRHRRWLQVVGSRLVPEPQSESFYSCVLESQWGRHGALLPRLDAAAAEQIATAAVGLFRARNAAAVPASFHGVAVLAAAGVVVLLHEAVAHALEADTLARGGRPEAAIGLALAAPCLDVLDDPAAAPPEIRRDSAHEGLPGSRRLPVRRRG